jgi:preprotein translocase subunit YajC
MAQSFVELTGMATERALRMLIRMLAIVLASAAFLAAGAIVTAQETSPVGGGTVVEPDKPGPSGAGEGVVEPDQPAGQAGPGEEPTTEPEKHPPGGLRGLFGNYWLVLMLGGFLLLIFWTGRGRRKEQQRRKEMLENLKKGDKVVSIGGIVGTVMEVKGDEITVKVDESSNVRMKFARWGIRGVGDLAKAEDAREAQRRQESGTTSP